MTRDIGVWASVGLGLLGLVLACDNLTGVLGLPKPASGYTVIALLPICIVSTVFAVRRRRLAAILALIVNISFVAAAALWLLLGYACSRGDCL